MAGSLPFYRRLVAWCSQWPNIPAGEALLALDECDAIAGYVLFRRILAEDGGTAEVKLLQAEADPQRGDASDVVRCLLAELSASDADGCRFTAENIPESNAVLNRILQEAGFQTVLMQHLMLLDVKGWRSA